MANAKPQRSALRRGNSAAYALNQFIFENSQWREQFGGGIILAVTELILDLLRSLAYPNHIFTTVLPGRRYGFRKVPADSWPLSHPLHRLTPDELPVRIWLTRQSVFSRLASLSDQDSRSKAFVFSSPASGEAFVSSLLLRAWQFGIFLARS
jgi:hypothetical protein